MTVGSTAAAKCDFCGKEIEEVGAEAKVSYSARETSFAGAYYFHFCSLECLMKWLEVVRK